MKWKRWNGTRQCEPVGAECPPREAGPFATTMNTVPLLRERWPDGAQHMAWIADALQHLREQDGPERSSGAVSGPRIGDHLHPVAAGDFCRFRVRLEARDLASAPAQRDQRLARVRAHVQHGAGPDDVRQGAPVEDVPCVARIARGPVRALLRRVLARVQDPRSSGASSVTPSPDTEHEPIWTVWGGPCASSRYDVPSGTSGRHPRGQIVSTATTDAILGSSRATPSCSQPVPMARPRPTAQLLTQLARLSNRYDVMVVEGTTRGSGPGRQFGNASRSSARPRSPSPQPAGCARCRTTSPTSCSPRCAKSPRGRPTPSSARRSAVPRRRRVRRRAPLPVAARRGDPGSLSRERAGEAEPSIAARARVGSSTSTTLGRSRGRDQRDDWEAPRGAASRPIRSSRSPAGWTRTRFIPWTWSATGASSSCIRKYRACSGAGHAARGSRPLADVQFEIVGNGSAPRGAPAAGRRPRECHLPPLLPLQRAVRVALIRFAALRRTRRGGFLGPWSRAGSTAFWRPEGPCWSPPTTRARRRARP